MALNFRCRSPGYTPGWTGSLCGGSSWCGSVCSTQTWGMGACAAAGLYACGSPSRGGSHNRLQSVAGAHTPHEDLAPKVCSHGVERGTALAPYGRHSALSRAPIDGRKLAWQGYLPAGGGAGGGASRCEHGDFGRFWTGHAGIARGDPVRCVILLIACSRPYRTRTNARLCIGIVG